MAKLQPFQLEALHSTEIERPTTIDTAREQALHNIDHAAGSIRLKYITSVPGQTEIYLEKTEEAIDYIAGGFSQDTAKYPLILSEANASGITCREAAEMIIRKKSVWLAKAAEIEEVRRRGKIAVNTLTTIEDVITAEQLTINALMVL